MKKKAIWIGILGLFMFVASEANAQSKVNVRFAAGKSSGSYNGAIRGAKYVDYVFRAKSGQILGVNISNNRGAPVYFNVLRSGSAVAISDDARQLQTFRGGLPDDGVYAVRVYMEKADRLRNRSASFRVSFTIE